MERQLVPSQRRAVSRQPQQPQQHINTQPVEMAAGAEDAVSMPPPSSSSGCPSPPAAASPLAPPGPPPPAASGEDAPLGCAAAFGLRLRVRMVLTTVPARLKCCVLLLPPCRLPPTLPLLPVRWWPPWPPWPSCLLPFPPASSAPDRLWCPKCSCAGAGRSGAPRPLCGWPPCTLGGCTALPLSDMA